MIDECTPIRELFTGGQKTVYLAEHPEHGQIVIKQGVFKNSSTLERISREVDILSQLESEYYPHQYHFDVDYKTKEFKIVEDYIDGTTLRAIMHDFKTPGEIFKLLRELILALKEIWSRNIVHRDLKPENIMIRKNGRPCIIDLGIARFLELDSLTNTLQFMGPCSPLYAAPEQLRNNKDAIDIRTDFFALGVIGLELYLGVHPFNPDNTSDFKLVVDNILQNKYIVSNKQKQSNVLINKLANKTLQIQPYQRIRNYKMFIDIIEECLL